jgi:hypothetical protein
MRWFKPNLKTSLYALLGHDAEPEPACGSVDRIRSSMLELLGENGPSHHALLVRRLRYASEPQALWYARSELMAALAAVHGEALARKKVDGLTPLFGGLLPDSLTRGNRQPA